MVATSYDLQQVLPVTDLADVWVHKWNIQSNPKVGQQDRRVAGSFQLVTTG